MPSQLCVNIRILQPPLTGVQRFVKSVLPYLPELDRLSPIKPLTGVRGHAWEQVVLPFHIKSRLLWSPVPSGPLTVRNQVVTVHDLVPLDNPEWLNPAFASWYKFLLPRLLRRVKHLIAISEFTRSRLVKRLNLDPEKISVVANGVDKSFNPQARRKTPEVGQALDLPGPDYILALGSLEPRKNLNRLLKAWQQILPLIPESYRLVIAGGGGMKRVFQPLDFARVPERVHWTGYVQDEYLPGLYAGARLFVFPSMYEGFGLPVLEAMACGCPVVCSHGGALPEVAADAAVLVDPFSVRAIAQALQTLINRPEKRQELRARGLVQAARFSWERTAGQTMAVLKDVHGSKFTVHS
ncbi:MAG: glycosyltransferase family 4 protein [Desulfohalobiaceae bacterium]|nr:glycosyltransferase family 4 protein [Desulfohalobiaceae bacterium]